MATRYVIGSVVASFGLAYVLDTAISDHKLLGGSTPRTVSKEWQEATEKMMDAWPRTAGPPLIQDPINRQSFIIKSTISIS